MTFDRRDFIKVAGGAAAGVLAAPVMPPTVTATFNDGSKDNLSTAVTWAAIPASRYAQAGSLTVTGTVPGTSIAASATVTVGT